MPLDRAWTGHSRTLTALLLAVVLPPAIMLVWLGLQLLQQDRVSLAQRELERGTAAAQAAAHALEARLADAERRLVDGTVPDHLVRFSIRADDIDVSPPNSVAWVPASRRPPEAPSASFQAAEALEFRGDAARALTAYQALSASGDPGVRAGALLRTARVLRAQRNWDGALRAYELLARIPDIEIAGAPSDLQARRSVCSVLAESGRLDALGREARGLETDLLAGRWALDRPAWELTIAELERWTGRGPAVSAARGRMSEVAAALWQDHARGAWPGAAAGGRRLVDDSAGPVTVVWRTQRAGTTALVIPAAALQDWVVRAEPGVSAIGGRLGVVTPDGRVIAGTAPSPDAAVAKVHASDSGLPWTIVVSPGPSSPLTEELATRRRLLTLGLVAILMFLGGGSWLLWRVIHRELAIVRQKRDFVSAVSHEFRTPLTSLRHVTELLQESDDVPAERRRAFYDALLRNTERLHRLVESLLDFSRMERGMKPYDRQRLDGVELVRQVAAEFERDGGGQDVALRLEVQQGVPLCVLGDRAALTHALWNLLDNAVKYSPGGHDVQLSVTRQSQSVAIAVRDRGLGIPARERTHVFRQFVRGEQAARLGIEGTGLGLAIVSHVVSAHGGSIELESEEGAGSTFRIVLPAVD